MNALYNDNKLLVFQREKKATNNLIIDYDCLDYDLNPKIDLFICSKEETLNLIPIMRCPNFKHKYFNSFDDLYESKYCYPKLSIFTLLLKKYEGATKYEKKQKSDFILT